jgi:hypothetical protein
MNARMSPSEMIVAGLAVAVLVAGFASGGFAKPPGITSYGSPFTQVSASQVSASQARYEKVR